MTDLILNLLSVFVYAWYYGHHGEHRAGGRARVTMVTRRRAGVERFVLLEIQKSLCWPGKLKWSLSGERLDFEVNIGFLVCLIF